ncbi:hypothetical protein J7X25_001085 [Vibrio parahaemolyticus]|nr:hypothetical protein [Vibrio parahaemolyticus]EJE8694796.1 hypothetical protein [Vibrio vulnificus]EKA7377300.1 hypothetical protein [Vibrio parahaemolyticus]
MFEFIGIAVTAFFAFCILRGVIRAMRGANSSAIGSDARKIADMTYGVPESFYNHCVLNHIEQVKRDALAQFFDEKNDDKSKWSEAIAKVIYCTYRHCCTYSHYGDPEMCELLINKLKISETKISIAVSMPNRLGEEYDNISLNLFRWYTKYSDLDELKSNASNTVEVDNSTTFDDFLIEDESATVSQDHLSDGYAYKLSEVELEADVKYRNHFSPVFLYLLNESALPKVLVNGYMCSDDFFESQGRFLAAAGFIIVGERFKNRPKTQESQQEMLEEIHAFICNSLLSSVYLMIEDEDVSQRHIDTSNEISNESLAQYLQAFQAAGGDNNLPKDFKRGRDYGFCFRDGNNGKCMSIMKDHIMEPIFEAFMEGAK